MATRKATLARRRRHLMELAEPDSILIVPSARECLRNGDSMYPFRQDSDFLYLTGFNEPDAVLVLVPGRDGGEHHPPRPSEILRAAGVLEDEGDPREREDDDAGPLESGEQERMCRRLGQQFPRVERNPPELGE